MFLLHITCFSFFIPSHTRTVCYSVFLSFLPSRTCTNLEQGFEAQSAIVDHLHAQCPKLEQGFEAQFAIVDHLHAQCPKLEQGFGEQFAIGARVWSLFVLCNDIFLGVGMGLVRNSFPREHRQEEEKLQVTESLVEAKDLGLVWSHWICDFSLVEAEDLGLVFAIGFIILPLRYGWKKICRI